jgi:hypothetical protein
MKNEKEVVVKEEVAKNRRNLLKAITAGGAAAAMVPAEWSKPLVKATVLPAHAQATVTGDCGIHVAYVYGGDSFYMSVTAFADHSCGETASLAIIDENGDTQFTCFKAGDGNPVVSWSCSGGTTPSPVAGGSDVTFVVSFDNGCSCSVVREVDAS